MSNQPVLAESGFDKSPLPAAEEGTARPAAPTAAKPRRKPLRLALLLALVAGAATWSVRYIHHMLTHETTENAYVTGSIHTVSSRLEGVVQEILVEENSTVTAGQPLVKLDSRDLEIRRDRARGAMNHAAALVEQVSAQLADAEAQAKQAHARVAQAAAQLARDEANATKAKADLGRASQLFGKRSGGLISRSDLDAAEAASQTTDAGVEAARAIVAAAQAAADSAKAKLVAAHAARDGALAEKQTAEAAFKEAELQLSYATITAPVAGTISRKGVEVGDRIQAGQALFALVEPNVWIEANFKETQLARMHRGQAVGITVDAIPDRTFRGTIESFSPATGAQFALLPPDNATGNFTKVIQRVPVKIVFAPESIAAAKEQIRPGLSTVVTIDVR